MSSSQLPNEHDPVNGRKPYMKPQLEIYGDLRQITQMVGNAGNDDMPSGNNHKTHT